MDRTARPSVFNGEHGIAGMSARKTEEEIAVRHPRETSELFGHREAETALLAA